MAKNPCQYWVEDEPAVCQYWDVASTVCTYTDFSNGYIQLADKAPYCNLIGTSYYVCKQYSKPADSAETRSRCVLPDTNRQASKHEDCSIWVRPVVSGTVNTDRYIDRPLNILDTSGEITSYNPPSFWTFADINGYNNGNCDGKGTTATCSGYSPYHLGFGPLKPQELTTEILTDLLNPEDFDIPYCITASGLGFRDPLSLSVFNLRAVLGRCKYWEGKPGTFIVDPVRGTINTIDYLCTNDDERTNLYSKYQLTEENGYIAPCNGAKPECPGYTSNICWQYVIDDYMAEGDKVLAEQILELRYYVRKEDWATLLPQILPGQIEEIYQNFYNLSFLEPDLYSWAGGFSLAVTESNTFSATIPAVKNYLNQFEYFDVNYETINLTAGIPTRNQPSYFPTLVRELKFDKLAPIIRTVFDKEELNTGSPVPASPIANNIFETSNIDHKYLAVWGDSFYYNSYVIAVNFSDPLLVALSDIYNMLAYYPSMSEMQNNLSEDNFNDIYNRLDTTLNNLIKYYPEKVFYSSLSTNENAFYIEVETFFGENNIIVFDSTDGFWEYDKISVVKTFMGAVIGQTAFSAEGDGGTVDNLPSYYKGFNSTVNKNCYVDFTLFPVRQDGNSSQIAYVYNNTIVDSKYYFQKYKVKVFENLFLDHSDVKFIGNKGAAVVIIPDEDRVLNSVHEPWGIEGDIKLNFIDPDGNTKSITMEIVAITKESLEVNQVLIKPKNADEFRSPCSFVLILGDYIYTYEKRSFSQTPEGDFTAEVPEESVISDSGKLEIQHGLDVTISNFPDAGILAAVVYRTQNGRIKGITRSKLLTWIRQPQCRDFEIKYLWDLVYYQWDLYPRGNCNYEETNAALNKTVGQQRQTFGPSCADHDKSTRVAAAPMWYPYNQCASTEKHFIISSAHGNIFDTMSVFNATNDDGTPAHGNWDLRMLGPLESYGTEESHASIWDCSCDFWYYNHVKASDNMFSGYARYRGGLSALDYEICVRDDGTPPKFGNVYREQLNSYRSFDRVKYYKISGMEYVEDYKWMPAPEHFTKANVFSMPPTVGYDLYTDEYDSPCYNQLGLLVASETIEGITIEESVDDKTRYRFDDIFRTNLSISLVYPKPKPAYVYLYDGEYRDIITWYTYRDVTDTSKSIHWAWQEEWNDIERDSNTSFLEALILGNVGENPYSYNALTFLDISYPNYSYDTKQQEHRQVTTEGFHDVKFVVSKPVGEILEENIEPYLLLQLGEGPARVFNLDGSWLDTSDIPSTIEFEGYDLNTVKINTGKYINSTLTGSEWITESTLFEEDDINDSEDAKGADQYLFMYDNDGMYYEKYYKRGLVVEPNVGKFDLLPKKFAQIPATDYEWKFSSTPVLDPESLLSNLVPDEYFPATITLDGAEYRSEEPPTFDITLDFSRGQSMYKPKVVTEVSIKFKYWVETEGLLAYNIPKVTIYKGIGLTSTFDIAGTIEKDMASIDNDSSIKTVTVALPWDYLSFRSPSKYFKLSFDTSLEASDDRSDIQGAFWPYMDNRIKILEVKLTEVTLESLTENLFTYERKYYVSTGSHGDIAPHGNDTTGEILNVPSSEMSTVYHTDTSAGIMGVPSSANNFTTMNKCRGRLLKPCYPDKWPYAGTDVHDMEKEQKKIHDSVAIEVGDTGFFTSSITPPGLKYKLDTLGLSFPKWECTFENTTTLALAPIVPQANYNDKGHRWDYDQYPPQHYYCGRGVWIEYFEYQYIDIATQTSYGSYSWMESQYQAAINRMEYGFWLYLTDNFGGGSSPITFYTGGQSTVDISTLTNMSLY